MEYIKKDAIVRCRTTGKSYKIKSIQGSWVELENQFNKARFFVSVHKILESYV